MLQILKTEDFNNAIERLNRLNGEDDLFVINKDFNGFTILTMCRNIKEVKILTPDKYLVTTNTSNCNTTKVTRVIERKKRYGYDRNTIIIESGVKLKLDTIINRYAAEHIYKNSKKNKTIKLDVETV